MSSLNNWATPPDLFAAVSAAFGPFTLDAAASASNTKCDRYYDLAADGLKQPWHYITWCNPPYTVLGEPVIGKWVAKAIAEAEQGVRSVLLIPYDASTATFNRLVLPNASLIVLLTGPRIRFIDPTSAGRSAPRGCHYLAVFGHTELSNRTLWWDWRNQPLQLA